LARVLVPRKLGLLRTIVMGGSLNLQLMKLHLFPIAFLSLLLPMWIALVLTCTEMELAVSLVSVILSDIMVYHFLANSLLILVLGFSVPNTLHDLANVTALLLESAVGPEYSQSRLLSSFGFEYLSL